MLEQELEGVAHYRQLMNEEKMEEANRLISDDFFAIFSLGHDSSYETYNAEQYRSRNLEATRLYKGKILCWNYRDLSSGMRFDNEIIVSSHIDFSLNKRLIIKAFCTEIYRKENDDWKLIRQYMEKYRWEIK